MDVTDDLSSLAGSLRLGLDSPRLCLACLSMVAFASDEAEARQSRRWIAPTLWLEGFGDTVRAALVRAARNDVVGAVEALVDLDTRSCRSGIYLAVLDRLAADLAEAERRSFAASLN